MKNKITLILLFLAAPYISAQQKSTGLVNLTTNVSATLSFDNGTSLVTLTLTGPNDRWFALQFGSFNGGMELGSDLVYWNNITLVDASHNGIGVIPTNDSNNNWTVTSNLNNSPSVGLRTIIATRAFNTGDTSDFVFNFNDSSIDLAWARSSVVSYSLSNHGNTNRGLFLDKTITLGAESFSLENSKLFPNPSSGDFTISTSTYLTKVNIYTLTGVYVKTIEVKDSSENVQVAIRGLETGVYLLELQNDIEKIWKKVIVN